MVGDESDEWISELIFIIFENGLGRKEGLIGSPMECVSKACVACIF